MASVIFGLITFLLIRRYPIVAPRRTESVTDLYKYTDIELLQFPKTKYEIMGISFISNVYNSDLFKESMHKLMLSDLWKFTPVINSTSLIAHSDYRFNRLSFFGEINTSIATEEVTLHSNIVDDMVSLLFENPLLFSTIISLIPSLGEERRNPLGISFTHRDYIRTLTQLIDFSFEIHPSASISKLRLLKRAYYSVFHILADDLINTIAGIGITDENERNNILLYAILHGINLSATDILESYLLHWKTE